MSGHYPNPTFDRDLLRRRKTRALAAPDFPEFLHERAARDITGRLDLILRDLGTALVIADRPDDLATQLHATGRFGRIITAQTIPGLAGKDLIQIVCDEECLPIAGQGLDCVISLLNLQQVNDLPGALIQIARALRPDGLFLGALLGGATLTELRHAWLTAESQTLAGASPRVAPFADIRELGSLLQRAGFALPVVDADRMTVTYRDGMSLMRELKQMGLANALDQRSRTPVTRQMLARACAVYEHTFAAEDGRIPATFEIIYLTGWAPHESQQQPLRPGSAKARLADALSTTEHSIKDK